MINEFPNVNTILGGTNYKCLMKNLNMSPLNRLSIVHGSNTQTVIIIIITPVQFHVPIPAKLVFKSYFMCINYAVSHINATSLHTDCRNNKCQTIFYTLLVVFSKKIILYLHN